MAVDGKILCLQQFDAEQGTEREDGLLLIGRRMEDVATEVGEQRCQAICLIAVEGQFRLSQFGCGEIDGTDDVVQGWRIVNQLLIIPGASHCDLYDGGYTELVGKGEPKNMIPWDKLEEFFKTYLR